LKQKGVHGVLPSNINVALVSGFHRALILKDLPSTCLGLQWIPIFLFEYGVSGHELLQYSKEINDSDHSIVNTRKNWIYEVIRIHQLWQMAIKETYFPDWYVKEMKLDPKLEKVQFSSKKHIFEKRVYITSLLLASYGETFSKKYNNLIFFQFFFDYFAG
jgi:hypothetical protein